MGDFGDWIGLLLGGSGALIAIASTCFAGVCVVVPFALLGVWLYRESKKRDALRVAALQWRTTPGRVLKSRVEVTGGENTTVNPMILYEYEVNGRSYQSKQIRVGDAIMSSFSSPESYALVDRYPEGAAVTVRYDPNDPQQAALEM